MVRRAGWRIGLVLCAGLMAVSTAPASGQSPKAPGTTFTDIAARAGLTVPSIYGGLERKRFIIETNGAGVAWVDVDGDGWLDALVLGGSRLVDGERTEDPAIARQGPTTRLYRNSGHGTFTDITAASGLGLTVFASSVCAGDYDNDGAVDLFITSYGRNYLFHNRGGRFEDVTKAAGLPDGPRRWGSGCTFVDYDRDGRLDLFVANYLRLDLGHRQRARPGHQLPVEGHPRQLRPEGPAHRHEPAVPQSRRRLVRGRVAVFGCRARGRALLDDGAGRGLR